MKPAFNQTSKFPIILDFTQLSILSKLFRVLTQAAIIPLSLLMVIDSIDFKNYLSDSALSEFLYIIFCLLCFVWLFLDYIRSENVLISIRLTDTGLSTRYLLHSKFSVPIYYANIQKIPIKNPQRKYHKSEDSNFFTALVYYFSNMNNHLAEHANVINDMKNYEYDTENYDYDIKIIYNNRSTKNKLSSCTFETYHLHNSNLLFETFAVKNVPLTSERKTDSPLTIYLKKLIDKIIHILVPEEDLKNYASIDIDSNTDIGQRVLWIIFLSLVGLATSLYGFNHFSQAQHLGINKSILSWLASLLSWIVCAFIAWKLSYTFIKHEGKPLALLATFPAFLLMTVFLRDAYVSTRWLIAEQVVTEPYAVAGLLLKREDNNRNVWQIVDLQRPTGKPLGDTKLLEETFWLSEDMLSVDSIAPNVYIYRWYDDYFIKQTGN